MANTLPAVFSTGPLDSGTSATEREYALRDGVHVGDLLPRVASRGTLGNANPAAADSTRRILDERLGSEAVAVEARPVTQKPTSTFHTRQAWQCVVERVHGTEFTATLADRTDPSRADEEASFDLEEVSPTERHLIQPGAVFYFFIGTERTPGGQQKNVSIIKVQRLPIWTPSALERAEARTRKIKDVLAIQ